MQFDGLLHKGTGIEKHSPAVNPLLLKTAPEGAMVGIVRQQGQVIDGQHVNMIAGCAAVILQIPYDLCTSWDT